MFLDAGRFRSVIDATALVAIDLVVRRADGALLLGERLNRPARGYWFVPGGRIRKGETLDAAFLRLTRAELGQAFERHQARLLDVYEHFYEDCAFGGPEQDEPSTHYVVLGYLLDLPADATLDPPKAQHGRYRWLTAEQMRADPAVHAHSCAYLEALR